MIIALLAICFILVIIIYKKKNALETQGITKNACYIFYKCSLEILLTFLVVGILYSGLLLIIRWVFFESVSITLLIKFEDYLKTVYVLASYFRLSATIIFIILLTIYILGLLQLSGSLSKKILPLLAKYQVWFRRVYLVILILFSFTLFGTEVGKPTADLRVRIKIIRNGYAELCKEVHEAISQEVVSTLYDKALMSFSESYRQALTLPREIESQKNSFGTYYSKAKTQYGINNFDAQAISNSSASRTIAIGKLKYDFKAADFPPVTDLRFNIICPNDITLKDIKKATKALNQFEEKNKARSLSFLTTEEGKSLTLHIPKLLSSRIKTQYFSAWMETYPILAPIIEVFFETLDQQIQLKVEKAIDLSTNSVIKNPENLQKIIENESLKIVNKIPITITSAISQKASLEDHKLHMELTNIQKVKSQIEISIQQSESKKIDSLIAQLANPNEALRENASSSLSQMGKKMGRPQFEKLKSILENGQKKWEKRLYREQHCTWYERTSIKYYAAKALTTMDSSYMDTNTLNQAKIAKSHSKTRVRVDDPGWV